MASTNPPPTPLYTVKDGNKVDAKTLQGWKTWRAMACERCHGAEQEGLVGPSLVNSLKVLTKDRFHTTITNGRLEKGMPNFGGVKLVTDNWEDLYAYLKGRSDGKIMPGHLYPIQADGSRARSSDARYEALQLAAALAVAAAGACCAQSAVAQPERRRGRVPR